MRIESMTLSDLLSRQHTKNPKEHDIDELIESFTRFGFTAPPTIDERTDVLVAGHGRALALRMMIERKMPPPKRIEISEGGDWLVPVIRDISFDTEQDRDAYVIADNAQALRGGWNLEKLLDMLSTQDSFDGIGFDDEELASFGVGDPFKPDGDDDEEKSKVKGHERKKKGRKPGLSFKIVITCDGEAEQAKLLERFEKEGLTCQPLIV